ncbi:gluconokinase [Nocardia alni]|uniref:gluconokinase n=1 Tax=Nocardia alni TaxID=2815723 RepID=UPI0020B34DEB|nr:gluconokinase [Nocardia alni]
MAKYQLPVAVMGVSGVGKSTVGRRLAITLGVAYADGDDLHPAANVAKMSAGIPLDDADRAPWLDAVGAWLAEYGGVVSCSALKRTYRDRLRATAPGLYFIELDASHEELMRRMTTRSGHFMPALMLESQLATLERLAPDEPGAVIDATQDIEVVVRQALAVLEIPEK